MKWEIPAASARIEDVMASISSFVNKSGMIPEWIKLLISSKKSLALVSFIRITVCFCCSPKIYAWVMIQKDIVRVSAACPSRLKKRSKKMEKRGEKDIPALRNNILSSSLHSLTVGATAGGSSNISKLLKCKQLKK
jgi:hypothetical protein